MAWKSETLALSERGGTNTQTPRGGANGEKSVAPARTNNGAAWVAVGTKPSMRRPISATPNGGKKKLFMKVFRLRLRSPPTAVIDPHDPRNEPDNYELKAPVVPDKFDYEE